MSKQTRVSHPLYNLLPTEIEGFDSLAELALDMRWSWNHATDKVWRPQRRFNGDREAFLVQLGHALVAGMIIIYAQGMALLAVASDKYGYHLDLETVARIWRGGCIDKTEKPTARC